MERLVEAIRVPCPNADYGCAATPAYYRHGDHLARSPHAPCHCPVDVCCFAGSPAALLDHFTGFHHWPCTDAQAWVETDVHLRDGFNAINLHTKDKQYLFLLNVERNPFGRAISAFFLYHDDNNPSYGLDVFVDLEYSQGNPVPLRSRSHSQETSFTVVPTDLSGGLPRSEDCFQVFVPKSAQPLDMDTVTINITIDLSYVGSKLESPQCSP
jgi:E3 ubiquitin-protein ligase SIAH1